MKKQVSFIIRLMSLILTFLLLFTMTIGTGITTVFAKEYKESSYLYVGDLVVGDILGANSVIHGSYGREGYNLIDAYFNGTKMFSNDDSMFLNNKMILLSIKDDPDRSDKVILEFADYGSGVEADSEDTLRSNLNNVDAITLSDDIAINSPIAISGQKTRIINTNGHTLSLNADKGGSLFIVTGGSTLILKDDSEAGGVLLGGNNMYDGGGAVHVRSAKLVMQNMTLSGNKGKNGGAIFAKSGTVDLSNCTIKDNYSEGNGGGVFIDEKATVTMTGCEIDANSTVVDGGGIANNGKLTLNNCKVTSNTAVGGAGIWSKGTATFTKTEVTENTNALNGGGVTNHGTMTLKECNISRNNATNNGGGVYIDTSGQTTFEGGNVISENAAKDGAGVFLNGGTLVVTKATMDNNTAAGAGGALWANSGTDSTFTDVKMSGNTCKTNGGCLNSHGKLSLTNCTIIGCSAEASGGAVYMDTADSLTVKNSEITGCQSESGGGGINFYSGSLILAGGITKLTGNTTGGRISNIYFREFKNIQVTGKLESESEIGFTPPPNSSGKDVTTGYGEHNQTAPSEIFQCDTNDFKVNREEGLKEVNLIEAMHSTNTSYKVKVHIRVTNDVDYWDNAYIHIYGRGGKGKGDEQLIHTSYDFHENIDDDGEQYDYEYDCGSDNFPTKINFITKFGLTATWRGFDAEVTVYINGVNVGNKVCVHDVYGVETKTSTLDIGGDKYPYPEEFNFDAPKEIDGSGVITISAADQYGLVWTAGNGNASMENISFPEEDTYEQADNTGFKWKLSSNHKTVHMSTYEITFLSGSNVYPKITKRINVKFKAPLSLSVVVDGKEVFSAIGRTNEVVQVPAQEAPPGFYILKWITTSGVGNMKVDSKDKSIKFTFLKEPVVLTAKLNTISYYVEFDNNAEDVVGIVNRKTAYYNKDVALSNKVTRSGYELVGWNTQADGRGTMFESKGKVKNLATKKGDIVKLYAIWKPLGASTSASIFSYGTGLIYVGAAILVLAVVAAVIYSVRKKKKEQRKE